MSPPAADPDPSDHLTEYPAAGAELVFRRPLGAPLRRNNFHRSVGWGSLWSRGWVAGGIHFHDLRHTGNTLAPASGASTRELIYRAGHGSMRAALIYQHATSDRAGKSPMRWVLGSGVRRRRRGPRVDARWETPGKPRGDSVRYSLWGDLGIASEPSSGAGVYEKSLVNARPLVGRWGGRWVARRVLRSPWRR
jgi:hypothetical protein